MVSRSRFKRHVLRAAAVMMAVSSATFSQVMSPQVAQAEAQWPKLVSMSASGDPGDLSSAATSFRAIQMSQDGRYVAFLSQATNLGVPAGGYPVYVRDTLNDTTEVASIDSNGTVISPGQVDFALSGNGRYVAFSTAGGIDVRDLQTDTNVHIPANYGGIRPTLSDDGDVIAFTFKAGVTDYVQILRVSTFEDLGGVVDTDGNTPMVSADGRYVAYTTDCCSNQAMVFDTLTASSTVASATADGTPGNGSSQVHAFSGNGRYVLFNTAATNLDANGRTGGYRKDMQTGELVAIDHIGPGGISESMSWDGDLILYDGGCRAADGSGPVGLCMYRVSTGEYRSVSLNKWGAPSNAGGTTPAMNRDGTFVAFAVDENSQYGLNTTTRQVYAEPTTGFATITDNSVPALGSVTLTANPAKFHDPNDLSVTATDTGSGVRGVVYTTDGSLPGPNHPGKYLALEPDGAYRFPIYLNNDLTMPGIYTVTVRAVDNADNWSDPSVEYLVVYDPTSTRMRGQGSVLPVYGTDLLPGLISATQNNKGKFGLLVVYRANGTINPNKSQFTFSYTTGTRCDRPNPNNCHVTNLVATTINWLVVNGTNDTHNAMGTFQGTATFTLDGVTTTNPFRVTGLDGSLMTPLLPDRFGLQVFAPGADPNTATPLYEVDENLFRGNIRVKAPAYGEGGGNPL